MMTTPLTSYAKPSAVFPSFFIPAAVLAFFYLRTAMMYQPAGRDIRRIESTSTSPIFASLGETLDGIITIRAFGMEARFLDAFFEKIDAAAQLYHMFWQVNRWLLLNFQMTSAIAILATTLFALSGYVDAGLAGICITSALSFTNSVYWVCRDWATLELDFKYAHRILSIVISYLTKASRALSNELWNTSKYLKNRLVSLDATDHPHTGRLRPAQIRTRFWLSRTFRSSMLQTFQLCFITSFSLSKPKNVWGCSDAQVAESLR